MAPRQGSPYANLPILTVQGPDGAPRTVVSLRIGRPTLPVGGQHRLRQGETPDVLAFRFFGDEELWWRILDANPVVYPLDLQPGQLIDLPGAAPATQITRARKF